MKKTFVFLLILTAIIAAVFVLRNSQKNLSNKPPFTDNTTTVETSSKDISEAEIILDFGNGRTESGVVPLTEITTAFSALEKFTEEKNIELKTKQYDFGIFVESIDGVESSAEKAWIYFVNGKGGDKAADQYEVTGVDKVEWKYITPEGA